MEGAFVEFHHVYAGHNTETGLSKFLGGKPSVPTYALKDITFSLKAHDHVTVFGPATSGKSTLLRLIAGIHIPHEGTIIVNGKKPETTHSAKAGYVSAEANTATKKSTTERIQSEIERAAKSDAPVILLDDVADVVGAPEVKKLFATVFAGRCVCITTRSPEIAEQLDMPILLLHGTALAHTGTRESIAHDVGVTRVVDAWIEGMRYDLLRKLRAHPGVTEVRLLPTDQFDGNKLRITIRNSRYLPSLYDVVSQAELIRIEELPPSLSDVLASLS